MNPPICATFASITPCPWVSTPFHPLVDFTDLNGVDIIGLFDS